MGMGGPRQGLTGRGGAGKGGGITSLMQQQHAQPPMQQVNSPALPAGYRNAASTLAMPAGYDPIAASTLALPAGYRNAASTLAMPAGYDPTVHVPSIGFMPGMQPAQPSMGQPSMGQPSMGQPGQPGAMQAAQHAAAEARYQAQQPMMPPSNPGEMRDFGVMPSDPLSMQYRQNAQRLENETFGPVPDSMRQMPMGGFGQPDQASMQAQLDQMAAMQQMNEQMRMQQMQQSPFGSQMRLPPQMQQSPFGSQMRLPPQMMNPQRYGGKGGSGGIHGLSSLFARQRFRR